MSRFPRGKEPTCPVCGQEKIHDRASAQCLKCTRTPGWHLPVPEVGTCDPKEGTVDRDILVEGLRESVKRYKGLYESALRQQAEEERLIALFKTAIASLPPLPAKVMAPPVIEPKGSPTVETPILLFGDLHVGEEIKREETYGINHYDFQVFQRRLEFLENRLLDICFTHQAHSQFPELVVFGLGDYVSGRIHVELQKYGAQHVVDQVHLGATCTALFLYRLAQHFPSIRYIGVSGNHGRLDKDKESKAYYKNFDFLWNAIVAHRLHKQSRISLTIPRAIFTVQTVQDKRFVVSHGMELPPSAMGLPAYSINRASAQYQELLAFAKEARYDYWALGHIHRPMELDNCIVNGSLSGLSELGIGKGFKPIVPTQKLLGVHKKWGMAWQYPIRLDSVPAAKVYTFDADMGPVESLELYEERTKGAAA